ncbi:MAG: hypothetical protein ACYCY6_01385 [Minisyncoccota bacterium]
MHLFRWMYFKVTAPDRFIKVENDFGYQIFPLNRLLVRLRDISRMEKADALDKLVFFFKILSTQDECLDIRCIVRDMKMIGMTNIKTSYGYTVPIEHLETLIRCVEYSARDKFGMNQARNSADVSDDTIFVNDVCNRTGVYNVHALKMRQYTNTSAYLIAQEISEQYVEDHIDTLMDILKIIVGDKPIPARKMAEESPRRLALRR